MRIPRSLILGARKIADNPYLNLLAALVLIATAIAEMLESSEKLMEPGIHHGIILLFGIAHMLSAVPELLHGLDEMLKADEETEETSNGRSG